MVANKDTVNVIKIAIISIKAGVVIIAFYYDYKLDFIL